MHIKEKRGGRAEEIVKGRAVHGGRSSCQLFTRVMCEQQRREHVTEEGCRVAKMVVARCFPDFQHARIDSTLETMCPKGPQSTGMSRIDEHTTLVSVFHTTDATRFREEPEATKDKGKRKHT
jgi:hypothetical protein